MFINFNERKKERKKPLQKHELWTKGYFILRGKKKFVL